MKNLKLWQKQYLSTLLLFLVVFYGCVFFLAHNSFSTAFSSAQEAAIREYTMIKHGIEAKQGMIAARGGTSLEADKAIVAEYGVYYSRRGVELSYMGKDGTILYSSIPADIIPEKEKQGLLEIKKDAAGNRYFSISAPVGSGYLGYIRETESIFIRQKQQNILLISAAAAFSLVLSISLYINLKRLYRPIDNLAHELRTPLTAIHGYAQYIAFAAIDEEERFNAASFIAEESSRLRDIIDRLLTLSNHRESTLDWSQVSTEELFSRTKKLYHGIQYKVEMPYVTGDFSLLCSLVGNLVDNAVKASSGQEEVELIAKENSIIVLDRGTGLSKAMCKRLNDTDGHGASTTGGSGLGIPLCHQIAKLHGARLTFENRSGGGTIAKLEFLQLQHNSIADPKYMSDMMKKKQGGISK